MDMDVNLRMARSKGYIFCRTDKAQKKQEVKRYKH